MDRLREAEDRLELATPRAYFVRRGLVLMLLVPALATMLWLLIGLLFIGEVGDATAWIPLAALGIPLALGAATSALAGAIRLARSATLARRSKVIVDLAAREIRPTDAPAVPLDAITAVRVRKPNRLMTWLVLEAAGPGKSDAANAFAASNEVAVRLLGDFTERQIGDASALGRQIAERLDVPFRSEEVPAGPRSLGMSSRAAAALAYVPVQGLFLIVSIALLVTKSDPYARRHALRSLILFGIELALILITALFGGGGFALLDPRYPTLALLAFVPLTIVALGRIVVRIVAAIAAYRG